MAFLWVEGVNFGACLYDTNDLSTIRGSSLLLDALPQTVEAELRDFTFHRLQSGASSASYEIEADVETVRAFQERLLAIIAAHPQYRHFSIVAGVGVSEIQAIARAKVQQMQTFSVKCEPVEGAWRHDELDGFRPAEPERRSGEKWLSPSVRLRRQHGRESKRIIDRMVVAGASWTGLFNVRNAQSFRELLEDPPVGVPDTVYRKLAVVHLDGDGFGKLREKATDKRAFSEELAAKMSALYERVVHDAVDRPEVGDGLLRLEVLIWGGDDITLIMPAWRVFDFFEGFYEAVSGWTLQGGKATFTGAAIVANEKTPIRQMVSLADSAVKASKADGACNAFTIDVFESYSVPDVGRDGRTALSEARKARYGSGDAALMAFPGPKAAELHERLKQFKRDGGASGLSRSVASQILAKHANMVAGTDADRWLNHRLSDYVKRVSGGDDDVLSADTSIADVPFKVARDKSFELRLLLDLWDYVVDES